MDEKLSKVLKRLTQNVELDIPLVVAEMVRRLRWSMGELKKDAESKGGSFDYDLHIAHTHAASKMKGVDIVAFPTNSSVEELVASYPYRMVQLSVAEDEEDVRDVMAMLFLFEEQGITSEFHYFMEDMGNRALTEKDHLKDLAFNVTRHDLVDLPEKVLVFFVGTINATRIKGKDYEKERGYHSKWHRLSHSHAGRCNDLRYLAEFSVIALYPSRTVPGHPEPDGQRIR